MNKLASNSYLLFKAWLISVLVCLSVNASPVQMQAEGIIQGIDLANQTLLISASQYDLLPAITVIAENGSKSYVGKLSQGDKVMVKYHLRDKQKEPEVSHNKK